MAEQFTKDAVLELKKEHPGYAVVAYVNTTSELKTVCDVCVTSSSAVKIVEAMPEKDIIFIPDINLGTYVAEQCPSKNLVLLQGGCPRHMLVSEQDVLAAKAKHPNALLLVHPECRKEVTKHADYIGSTSGIMNFAKESNAEEFIIGTENSIVEHLQYDCPEKSFYPVSKNLVCMNMKLTTLPQVYKCCLGKAGEEIEMSEDMRLAAKKCIDKMIEYGG